MDEKAGLHSNCLKFWVKNKTITSAAWKLRDNHTALTEIFNQDRTLALCKFMLVCLSTSLVQSVISSNTEWFTMKLWRHLLSPEHDSHWLWSLGFSSNVQEQIKIFTYSVHSSTRTFSHHVKIKTVCLMVLLFCLYRTLVYHPVPAAAFAMT